MSARFRLPSTFALGYGLYARSIINTMKHYVLVLPDNGSPWFFQGSQAASRPPVLISALKRIPASAFVAVDTEG